MKENRDYEVLTVLFQSFLITTTLIGILGGLLLSVSHRTALVSGPDALLDTLSAAVLFTLVILLVWQWLSTLSALAYGLYFYRVSGINTVDVMKKSVYSSALRAPMRTLFWGSLATLYIFILTTTSLSPWLPILLIIVTILTALIFLVIGKIRKFDDFILELTDVSYNLHFNSGRKPISATIFAICTIIMILGTAWVAVGFFHFYSTEADITLSQQYYAVEERVDFSITVSGYSNPEILGIYYGNKPIPLNLSSFPGGIAYGSIPQNTTTNNPQESILSVEYAYGFEPWRSVGKTSEPVRIIKSYSK